MVEFESYLDRTKKYFKGLLTKAGLISPKGFGYRRNAVISYVAIVAVCSAIFFFLAGYYLQSSTQTTAKNIQITTLENQLNSSEYQLNSSQFQLNQTQAKVSSVQSQLSSAQQNLASCQENASQMQGNLTQAKNFNAIIQSDLSSCQSDISTYNSTLSNSVQAVCCSFGEIQAGSTENWSVSGNRIICSGGSTVNCATGSVS